MPAKQVPTVTQNGMTKSQPGTMVSIMYPWNNGVCLRVGRYYNIHNKFGGYGIVKRLDSHEMWFETTDAANKFALSRGYSQVWYKRSHPKYAYQAATETVKRGEYKGKRKLTRWLIAHLDSVQGKSFFCTNWFGESC